MLKKTSISTRIYNWARLCFVSNFITAGFSNPSFRVKFGSPQFLERLLSDKKKVLSSFEPKEILFKDFIRFTKRRFGG